ncbi:MAG: hypothetical protein H6978_07815 [Gammaproteobacteria bacterium]|nr:hypothetical protein [Gammaproteobacteria bacterium]
MSYGEILLEPRILALLLGFCIIAMLEPLLEVRLARHLQENDALRWYWNILASPLLRSMLIVSFVVLGYPTLFGLVHAPSLRELSVQGYLSFNNLVGVVFLVTLIFPWIPGLGRHAELVLPAQGLAATALLFHWYTGFIGATSATPFPGWALLGAIAALAWLLHRVAQQLAVLVGQELDRSWHLEGSRLVLLSGLEILIQGPLILALGAALGRQIAV